MKTLSALVLGLSEDRAAEDVTITSVTCDSREARGGTLMVCVPGAEVDGHRFAESAVRAGAAALVVERPLAGLSVPQVRVADARSALGTIAARFHDHPSTELDVVGVTGTNGKTTIVAMGAAIGRSAGWSPGTIGTLGILDPADGAARRSALNTTPGSDVFQRALRDFVTEGARAAFVEVSSHALAMHRVRGTDFRVAVFSNLSRDHLDFHGTMDDYEAAKARLFRTREWGLDETGASVRSRVAVLPSDDEVADRLAASTDLEVLRYGEGPGADVRLTDIELTPSGSRARLRIGVRVVDVMVPIPGRFNLRNAAAAAAACHAVGASPREIVDGLASIPTVPGRLEPVAMGQGFAVVIDFAHTADAVTAMLSAVREWTRGRVLLVIGAGGDRDRGKRPEMGRAAVAGADLVVFTSDNPRTEDPEAILDQVVSGAGASGGSHGTGTWTRVTERAEAVRVAITEAADGDTVVIAGKGHERVQIVGTEAHPSDDRDLARSALAERGFAGESESRP